MDCAGADCGDHGSVNELKEELEKGCKDLTVQAGAEGKEGTGAGGKTDSFAPSHSSLARHMCLLY